MPTNFATRVILLITQRKFQELYHRWFPYLCMQFPLTKWWHIHWIPLISHDYRDYLPVRAPLLHHVDKKPNFAPKNGKIVFFSPHLHTLTILAFPAWLSHLFLWFLDPDELNITKTVLFFFLGIVTVAPITLSYAIRKWLFPSVFHLSLGNYPMISQHLPIPNAIRALHSSFWASQISARRPANKRQGLETAEEMFVLRVYLTIVRMSY